MADLHKKWENEFDKGELDLIQKIVEFMKDSTETFSIVASPVKLMSIILKMKVLLDADE